MSSGIETPRDFVKGIHQSEKDWHGLTEYVEAPLTPELFPIIVPAQLSSPFGPIDRYVLISRDDNKPCGEPFAKSFGYLLPQTIWKMIEEALAGTAYTVERMGMLCNRALWFVSVKLDELASVSRPGEKFNFGFSGGLDGSMSPNGYVSHTRIVCMNTLRLSQKTGNRLFCIRQSAKSHEKLDSAKADVERAIGMVQIFNTVYEQLGNTFCSVDTARAAYAGEIALAGGDFSRKVSKKTGEEKESRARNTVDELVSLFESGIANGGNTKADLLNGFTEFGTRGRKDTTKSVLSQVESSEFGGMAERKNRFFELVTDEGDFENLIARGKAALAMN